MILRWKTLFLLCVLLSYAATEESPPGLVSKDSEQDLVAEATQSGGQAQKREAGLSNSYGEPLPPDAYGPPREIPTVPDVGFPAPVYGVPDLQISVVNSEIPSGAYGPPSPVVFPSQVYDGPPPPIFKPKPIYGPPKHYGYPKFSMPKPIYGPPKKIYGPPKQSLPKPTYGVPFKPPKVFFPKPVYGVPKPSIGFPKPVYGPPKVTYGAPLINIPPTNDFTTVNVGTHLDTRFENIDLGLNLPAPIYGTPITSLPTDLKPNFPIPSDTYGPPGHILGPVGPNDQVVVQDFDSVGHYGPPQPDPNPQPPHPGIPAPPTPPHVLYDGWKPIPGVSVPTGHVEHTIKTEHIHHNEISNDFGPPPPPPVQDIYLNIHGDELSGPNQFNDHVSNDDSNIHHDALANIDLNAIVGGDSNHIDQSKTIFEAHYTEHNNGQDGISHISGNETPFGSYGVPEISGLVTPRQHGAKGLIPPSGVYGVPPSGQYGVPKPAHLPIPYGTYSGGGHSIHTGGRTPVHPVKFREPVPDGLLQQVAHTTHHKDHHGLDHVRTGPPYVPPPIRDIKDTTQYTGTHGVSLSIEPSNLYSLPNVGNPINFQQQVNYQSQNNLYGSPVDSYSAPLFTVSDHQGSASNTNSVTASVDGRLLLANLSNLEAAAILKHCPYHEAILKAARAGEKIPQDLASSYVASLSSLGSTLTKNQQAISQNQFNAAAHGSESVSFNTKDLSTASQTLVQTVYPSNDNKNEKEKNLKGKSLKDKTKQDEKLQYVSNQILQTSQKIKNLSEETKQLQQKIESTGQNINQFNGQFGSFNSQVFGQVNNGQVDIVNGQSVVNSQGTFTHTEIPVKGKHPSYSVQIQSSESGNGKVSPPSIPHEQLLSEGLLQSILQAIEQPNPQTQTRLQNQNIKFEQSGTLDLTSLDAGGLVLPAGYEPVDRSKDKVQVQKSADQDVQSSVINYKVHQRGDIPETNCERTDNLITHTIIMPIDDTQVNDIDNNDVAIYFNEKTTENTDNQEPVTEISVATSISGDLEHYGDKKPEFGDKIGKKQK